MLPCSAIPATPATCATHLNTSVSDKLEMTKKNTKHACMNVVEQHLLCVLSKTTCAGAY